MKEIEGVVRFIWRDNDQWDVYTSYHGTWEYNTSICARLRTNISTLLCILEEDKHRIIDNSLLDDEDDQYMSCY